MLKSILTVLSLTLILAAASPASASTVIEDGSWPFGEKAVEVLELAQEKGRPIVLLMSARKTSCPKCISGSQATIRAKQHKSMARIIYYFGNAKQPENPLNEPEVRELAQHVYSETGDFALSMTAYFTPDRRLIGYVPYSQRQDVATEAKTVMQIHNWMLDVAKETEKADALAERGRYKSALAKLENVNEQDAKISHLTQQLIGKAKEDDEMPDEPVSPFFADLYDTKLAEYKANAAGILAEVQALFDDEAFKDAQRAIRTIKQTPESFGVADQVKQLSDKIDNALSK